MDDKNLLQKKLLEMLKFFHQYCEDNGLSYIALGGTMLGAVRHKGFIPWDDDIDVGMPRADFEKLMCSQGTRVGKYYLEGPGSKDKGYCTPYAKLYDTETTLIENTRFQLVRGIYLDIFPLDGLTNDVKEIHVQYKKIEKYRNRLLLRTLAINKERKWYKNLLIRLARLIPFGCFNEKILCERIDALCKSKEFSKYKYGGNLLGAWRSKEVMERDIVGTPRLYDFEDFRIYGAEKGEEYLTKMYGDWKKLPPVEKRVSHHDYYLDLTKSYLEYGKRR